MHEMQLDRRVARAPFSQRLCQPLHRESHGGRDGARRLAFDERHRPATTGHEEIHLQPLFVAEVVKLAAPARVHLALGNRLRSSIVLPARRGPVSTTAAKLRTARATCSSRSRWMYFLDEISKVTL